MPGARQVNTSPFGRGFLFSLPHQPLSARIADIFDNNNIVSSNKNKFPLIYLGRIWTWDNNNFISTPECEALNGYWIFMLDDAESQVKGFPLATSNVQLKAGWNLWGPEDTNLNPFANIFDVHIVKWKENKFVTISQAANNKSLDRGIAYWIYSNHN